MLGQRSLPFGDHATEHRLVAACKVLLICANRVKMRGAVLVVLCVLLCNARAVDTDAVFTVNYFERQGAIGEGSLSACSTTTLPLLGSDLR